MSELDIDLTDRCDQCGAQAFAKSFATPGGSFLLFCAHHFRQHQLALDALGWLPVDHTDRVGVAR